MKNTAGPENKICTSRRKAIKDLLLIFICLVSGMLYASALPPLNWNWAILFVLPVLFYCGLYGRWYFRLLCGWVWGLGWSLFAYRFLREIHPAVPWLLAPVISLWPALFTLLAGFWARRCCGGQLSAEKISALPPGTMLRYLSGAAVLFTLTVWSRYYLFVWNDLSVTLWQVPVLMQIARLTGRYGVSLLITLANAALFALIFCRKRRWMVSGVLLLYPLAAVIYGAAVMNIPEKSGDNVIWRCALIQGNLPEQRIASAQEVVNSIRVYTQLSHRMKQFSPQTIIWPECAVPIPLREQYQLGEIYRYAVKSLKTQMLIGSLDITADNGITNSALLLSPDGEITGRYDKFHRVPYGEYVPFRELLPESWIEKFDMGRDLTAGKEIRPLDITGDIRSGTAVCYEGVFSYLSAAFARKGANVLTVLSNDVWYPQSSEPEQHLANAVMRCVETGLPMVRCGNNGGSGVVNKYGVFTSYIGSAARRPELLREQAAGIVEVKLERHPEVTPAVFMENWIVYLLMILLGTGILFPAVPVKK